jgi:voltage-gated potassium channel
MRQRTASGTEEAGGSRPGRRADATDASDVLSLRIRLGWPLALFTAVVVTGTAGYWWLWRAQGGTWMDGLFMTITTITTIGYGEVKPLGTAGRVFTMVLALAGIGSVFYTAGVLMEHLVATTVTGQGRRRKMERCIETLRGHVVVAGLGRVGREAAWELSQAGRSFVVVDPGPGAARHAAERRYLLVEGDATDDAVLERAGIRRASGLVVTTANDATNMFIIMSARVLNPGLIIVSRAADGGNVPKLMRAGATRAISPYAIGGHRLAHLILKPTVVDFFETALGTGTDALNIEDLAVTPDSPAVGQALDQLDVRRVTGATILAVLRENHPLVSPPGNFVLSKDDQVLALGTRAQLRQLERLLTDGAGASG